MWRFVSSLADTIAGLHLFECLARVMKPQVEASEIEPNIRLIILFLLMKTKKERIIRSFSLFSYFISGIGFGSTGNPIGGFGPFILFCP